MTTKQKIATIAACIGLLALVGIAGKMDADYEAERSTPGTCTQAQITGAAEICR
jgi:hypothetical protein